MKAKTQEPRGHERAVSVLNGFILTLDVAKEASSIVIPQAKIVFGSAIILLTSIRVRLLALC